MPRTNAPMTDLPATPHDGRPDRVMVIVAHPDDADFGPSATLAAWIRAGSVGHLVCCTSGDAGADDPRVAKCVYDSDGGLGGAFANGQGTLMGCPLSTDRARLFLNSIVAAIEMTAKGVRLWGSQTAGRDGGWRVVAQLMCADDWLGTFESVEELRAAWGLWCLWEPITGAKVGIKAADKTVLTGMRFGDNGCVMAVEDPVLTTGDGRVVPVRPPSYAYKHLGQWRSADASDITARKKLRASMGRAVRRVKQMPRNVTRYQALIVSDALVGGLASFYLAGMYITMGEAEKMEASWRAVFNNRTRRARDTPRAALYADTWAAGRSRRHVYAHRLALLYTAVASALAANEDLEPRAAACAQPAALRAHTHACTGMRAHARAATGMHM